jgi:lauroyl/myristoyl acyltransferase
MTQYVRGAFEAGMLWHWPVDRVLDLFDDTESMELFFEAERTGSGVMLVGAHAGPWELLGLFMQKHLSGSILYKPGRHADVEEMNSRISSPVKPLPCWRIRNQPWVRDSLHRITVSKL